jgi:hypothetical protein
MSTLDEKINVTLTSEHFDDFGNYIGGPLNASLNASTPKMMNLIIPGRGEWTDGKNNVVAKPADWRVTFPEGINISGQLFVGAGTQVMVHGDVNARGIMVMETMVAHSISAANIYGGKTLRARDQISSTNSIKVEKGIYSPRVTAHDVVVRSGTIHSDDIKIRGKVEMKDMPMPLHQEPMPLHQEIEVPEPVTTKPAYRNNPDDPNDPNNMMQFGPRPKKTN